MGDLSDALDSLQNGISGIVGDITQFPGTSVATAIGGAVVGGALTGAVVSGVTTRKTKSRRTKRKSSKKITHTKRGWKQDRKRRSKQKWEVAYQKRKKRKHSKRKTKRVSRKGIHFTKNGQPYKILSSGKARFIKRRR